MKLFLSSVGVCPETRDAFFELLGRRPEQTTVAFIPTACDPEEDKSYLEGTVDQIKTLGLKLIVVDLKGEKESSLYERLENIEVIFVNGGNPFYLLDWVRRSGFNKIITRLLKEGKLYVGVSAGSYIACPSIEMAKWKSSSRDVVGLTDYSALSLVNFLISAHYREEYRNCIEQGSKATKLPVVAITDRQAIVVDGEKIKIAGPVDEMVAFNGFSLPRK